MKNLVLAGVLAFCAVGFAQETKETLIRTPKHVAATNAPVTSAEAKAVFTKAERIARSVLGLKAGGASPLVASNKPVTRVQVVGELTRLYKLISPSAKLTPRPVKFEAGRLRMTGAPREDLVRLVRLGAIAPVGPVAAGPKDSLTVAEFGDAIGYFLARMAEMTHMPSRKWTPALQAK